MGGSVQVVIGIAVVAVACLMAVATYRWRQRARVRRVERLVRKYLSARYGGSPGLLHVNCSDDRSWPVLVDFTSPRTGIRHRLQFTCGGKHSTFALLSEEEEVR